MRDMLKFFAFVFSCVALQYVTGLPVAHEAMLFIVYPLLYMGWLIKQHDARWTTTNWEPSESHNRSGVAIDGTISNSADASWG